MICISRNRSRDQKSCNIRLLLPLPCRLFTTHAHSGDGDATLQESGARPSFENLTSDSIPYCLPSSAGRQVNAYLVRWMRRKYKQPASGRPGSHGRRLAALLKAHRGRSCVGRRGLYLRLGDGSRMRREVGSGRHGCKSGKVKVLPPSIACQTASMPDACIGDDA